MFNAFTIDAGKYAGRYSYTATNDPKLGDLYVITDHGIKM
jgi:hypothetical protein